MVRPPHPALRATFSREGRRKKSEVSPASPSPLAGEGGSRHLRETDEGVFQRLQSYNFHAESPPHSALRATFPREGGRGIPAFLSKVISLYLRATSTLSSWLKTSSPFWLKPSLNEKTSPQFGRASISRLPVIVLR